MPAKLPTGRQPLKGRNINIDAELFARLQVAASDSGEYIGDVAKRIMHGWISRPTSESRPAAASRPTRNRHGVAFRRLFLRTDDRFWSSLVERAAADAQHLQDGFGEQLRAWLDEHAPVASPARGLDQQWVDLVGVVNEVQTALSKFEQTLLSLASA